MDIVLSSSSGVPMYEQIKNQIRAAVYSGDLAVGDSLPSLRRLAADVRVSAITVTRAYNDLVAERLVKNEHGRGFTVLPVDTEIARSAMADRLDAAVVEAVAAARAAQVPVERLHALLDTKWSES